MSHKVWRIKEADQPTRPVKPPQATGTSDRLGQLVRPVDPSVQQKAESAMPVLVPCDGETPLAFSLQGDEGLVG